MPKPKPQLSLSLSLSLRLSLSLSYALTRRLKLGHLGVVAAAYLRLLEDCRCSTYYGSTHYGSTHYGDTCHTYSACLLCLLTLMLQRCAGRA